MTKNIYMAGLLDGEGTIGITRQKSDSKYRSPYISISSTTPEIIEWLQANYGGHTSVQKVYQPHHKPSWSWKLRKIDDIISLLEETLPHMLEPEKIRRGNMIINEYKSLTPRNGKYSDILAAKKRNFEYRFLGI